MKALALGFVMFSIAALGALVLRAPFSPDTARAFDPPTSGVYLAVDCNRAVPGIQDSCDLPANGVPYEVDIVFGNVDVPDVDVSSFQFNLVANQTVVEPLDGVDGNQNANPDFNNSGITTGNWNCSLLTPSKDQNPDPAVADSRLACLTDIQGPIVPAGGTLLLATTRYNVVSQNGTTFVLGQVAVGKFNGVELMSCNPVIDNEGPCFPATTTPPPTPTPTNTHTPPVGPTHTPTMTPTATETFIPTPTFTATPTATNTPIALVDTDADGMFDVYEVTHPCLNVGAKDADTDPDSDLLLSLTESQLLTDACAADSDMDTMDDKYEVDHDTCLDPLVPDGTLDADEDTLTNVAEHGYGTNPCNKDTDYDGYVDGKEIEISEDPLSFCAIMRADVSDTGHVNVIDLFLTAREAGAVPPKNGRMDQNADNVINVLDLRRVALQSGKAVTECP